VPEIPLFGPVPTDWESFSIEGERVESILDFGDEGTALGTKLGKLLGMNEIVSVDSSPVGADPCVASIWPLSAGGAVGSSNKAPPSPSPTSTS